MMIHALKAVAAVEKEGDLAVAVVIIW